VRRAGVEKSWIGANHLSEWILRSGSGLEPSLFGIFIRRMIVAMMDANLISERLSSLKNEMSELRVTNALYCNRKGYTELEKSASGLRHRRLGKIKLELAALMKRCA
jgi:hypothetical protein